MVSSRTEILRIAKRYIAHLKKNRVKVERAYLYGSYAAGKPHADSDIDIVVVSRQFRKSRYEDSVRIAKLRREIDLRIQPLAYNPRDFVSNYVIPFEAMTKGIRIA